MAHRQMVGDVMNAKRWERELRNAAKMNQMLNLHEEKALGVEAEEEQTEEEEKSTFSQMSYLATTYTKYDMCVCVCAVCTGYKCVVHIVSG